MNISTYTSKCTNVPYKLYPNSIRTDVIGTFPNVFVHIIISASGLIPFSIHGFNQFFVNVLYSFRFSYLGTSSTLSIFFLIFFGSLKSPPD